MQSKLTELALQLYLQMQKENNFGEAGADRVKIDFARHLLKIPSSRSISTQDLDKFDQLIQAQKPASSIEELTQELRAGPDIIFAARKNGFPIILYGPTSTREQDGYSITILEKELARTPASVLSILAFTQADRRIVIRREALEHVFWIKWASPHTSFKYKKEVLSAYGDIVKEKKVFIDEMMETILAHEICHAVVAQTFKDQDLYIFGKMLDAYLPDTLIDALYELLAEWEPEHGALPYLAKIAQKDQLKARRMFFRYVADAIFFPGSDQAFLGDYSILLLSTLKPFMLIEGEIDFDKLSQKAKGIYERLYKQLEVLLKKKQEQVKSSSFKFNGFEVSYSTLAKVQHEVFKQQNPEISKESACYKKFFWANMANYFKNCAKPNLTNFQHR